MGQCSSGQGKNGGALPGMDGRADREEIVPHPKTNPTAKEEGPSEQRLGEGRQGKARQNRARALRYQG